MKKYFFMLLLATLSFFALPASSQTIPASEIMKIIDDNDWENFRNNGVVNPDLILPGQTVSYRFNFTVQPGESQYSIVRDRLSKLTAQNGEVVAPPQKESVRSSTPQKPLPMDPVKGNVEIPWDDADLPWWVWPIIVAIIALAVFGGIKSTRNNNKRYEDPVTAGPPQVPGGIRDNDAYGSFRNRAAHEFPGATIEIRNLRRGRLSGQAIVHYADGKSQEKVLDNIFAYEAEVVANGQSQIRYCLQGCGNDLRAGNFMSGNKLVFTPDANIQEDGTATPVPPAPVTPTADGKSTGSRSEKSITHDISITTPPTPSDCIMKGLEIVQSYVSGSEVKHRVTFDLTREGLKVVMEGQSALKKQTSEKTSGPEGESAGKSE